jgi:hypothetical protein
VTGSPHARWSHRPGMIQLDVPAPELSLSTVRPVGTHLVLMLESGEALALIAQLTRLLGKPAPASENRGGSGR